MNKKKVLSIHKKPSAHWVGDGFPVRTIFSAFGDPASRFSPFLLLDYAGPKEFPPSNTRRGVDEHPHRGFETVTIVYQGELEHRDSGGNQGKIGPSDVQWMTAASGVVHEEKHAREFTQRGGTLELIQLWVNLPAEFKMSAPRYQELLGRQIPLVRVADGGGTARVIAGEFQGQKGPARTFTPVNLWDVRLKAGHRLDLTLPGGYTTALFILRAKVRLSSSETAGEVDLVQFERDGEQITMDAEEDSSILVLNGEPIDEPIASYGPFVMNTQEEIRQAVDDYRSGRMGRLASLAHR
ncbi:MAG TPA: pirin family protein [Candidatus Binatia bacterium]|nr:pirin family protein [Candidatus Binatia bacterium]